MEEKLILECKSLISDKKVSFQIFDIEHPYDPNNAEYTYEHKTLFKNVDKIIDIYFIK